MTDELETKMREKARKLLDDWCGEWRAVHLDKFTEEITQALLDVAREGDEYRIQLEAWQNVFGTSQLSHASAQLESAEQQLAQARAELAKVATALGQSAVAEAALRADLERARRNK